MMIMILITSLGLNSPSYLDNVYMSKYTQVPPYDWLIICLNEKLNS